MRMTGRRWLAVASVAWVVVLVVAAFWSAGHDPATVREQSPLQRARQTVDAAVAAVREAAGPDVPVRVSPYELTEGCRISLARDGAELVREVVLTVPAGQEPELLGQLADRLPESWKAHHHRDRLYADAGDFVSVRGEVPEPGRVWVTLDTGCRG